MVTSLPWFRPPGTLNPVNTVQVGSQVSGTILHLHADFTTACARAQVIAQIDPAVFRAKLAEAEANLKSARPVSTRPG